MQRKLINFKEFTTDEQSSAVATSAESVPLFHQPIASPVTASSNFNKLKANLTLSNIIANTIKEHFQKLLDRFSQFVLIQALLNLWNTWAQTTNDKNADDKKSGSTNTPPGKIERVEKRQIQSNVLGKLFETVFLSKSNTSLARRIHWDPDPTPESI